MMMPIARRLGIAWLALASVGAAATASVAQTVQAPEAGTRSVLRDGAYVLQAGDELTIRVFRQPELDETVTIRPDGRLSVVLLDELAAAGLTTEELDRQLTTRYAEFFKEPEVTVIVRNFANLKVFVGGEVGRPGPVPLVGELTMLSAVFQAGGFTPTARMDSVILIRNGGEQPLIQRINAKDAINKGRSDVALRPFDVVYVPLSRIAKADRFVDQYFRQLLPISLTAGFSYIMSKGAIIIP